MGALINVVDSVLFFFFAVVAVGAVIHDGQIFFPHLYPPLLVEHKTWYVREYEDYLYVEEPHFFVGLIALEILFMMPLAVASLYAIVARKPWLNTTCLIFGASFFTGMVATLTDMKLSKKASAKNWQVYVPFLGFSVLALLRGLFGPSEKAVPIGKRPSLQTQKKRA